ncbi:L,D-transpeptidase family protein [Oceanibium sediminis]|uniref:L,D-transpeptidase family protein n=1 Tax=Oceanibium sediminis TaxID=2026339 RepID=UPI001E5945DA|nr:L,D-transpeptidase family protein [Oceanibium sediminis]
MRDALVAGGDALAPLARVYEVHDFQPIWDDGKSEALLASLWGAGDHGLPVARYRVERLAGMAAEGTDARIAREIAFSRAFLRYARDVNSGLLEPRSADRDIVVSPKRPDPVALLEGLADTPDAADYIAALAPGHKDYENLLAEKKRLEALIAAGGWGEAVANGPTLRQGDTGPRVTQMRTRLGAMDGVDYGTEPTFDLALADAVKAFQLRHGLNDDGVAGPKTIEALNATPTDRLKQVLVNLERQRWLNYDRGDRHIYVNQADFTVQLIDHGKVTLHSRVVIGKNRHRTQEFNDEMTHMVVNPTWHVPRSIATEEMLPKLQRNPNALGGSMQVMTRSGTRINPALVDFNQFNASNFPFIVKQLPGGGNALGRVKFMFPNKFSIYLHDTPTKSLFAKDTRAYSHGCVRVQKPFELAELLLAPQSDDPAATFRRHLDSGSERYVNLETPVPVYLTYQSAWVDGFGVPQYRADIYGRDGRVFDALSKAGVTLAAVEG